VNRAKKRLGIDPQKHGAEWLWTLPLRRRSAYFMIMLDILNMLITLSILDMFKLDGRLC